MSSPPFSGSARRARYSRSPSGGAAPPSKRSKPSSSNDAGNNSDQHRVYTSICVKNINPRITDPDIREMCERKFSKYGQNSVKIYYKNQDRVAFVNFTSAEDARRARHAKTGLVWENMLVVLEPVYYRRTVPAEQPLNPSSPRSPSSPRRRPRRPATPASPPRARHRRSATPPRPRRHYSPYIPLPPDLAEYAGKPSNRARQGSPPPSPVRSARRRSRTRSPSPFKNRAKSDESNVQHEPTRTLFVGNLEREVKESKIRDVFGRYGKIEEVDLKVPQSSSKRAYAFIQYENMDMAYEARREMDGRFIGKADCKIGYGKIVPTNCLWVGNVPMNIKRRDLEQAFARYGPVKSLDYTNGEPTAIVSYNVIEDAIKARGKMTGVTQIIDGKKVRADSGQSDSTRRDGIRIDYLDRPTARRFVIVRPQNNPSRSRSRSSISNDDTEDKPKLISPIRYRTPSPSTLGQTFVGPLGTYLTSEDTEQVNSIADLFKLCERRHSSSNSRYSSVFPVEFVLKSHAYDARLHFLAGNPQLAENILGERRGRKVELKVTQRLHFDPRKLEELEGKLRSSVSKSASKANRANQTIFAILLTSAKGSLANGNHPASSDENEERSQMDDPSSISHFISYLASKEAAGVITLPYNSNHDEDNSNEPENVVLNIFPACQFSKKLLRMLCPAISFSNGPRTPPSRPTTNEHLMVVITHSD